MIVEFRIPLPIEVSDFEVAQLFMIVKLQENVTGGGEGVIVLKNETFDNTDGHLGTAEISGVPIPREKGQYTLKHYMIGSMMPSLVKAFLPKDALYLVEEAWNCHPHCLTVITNGYLSKDRFKVIVESRYTDNDGEIENIMNLDAASLKKRERVIIDIAKHDKDIKPDEDVTQWHSDKRNIGPLRENWYRDPSYPHIMWCYKNVSIKCKYFGLQSLVENLVRKQQEMIFKRSMCQMIVQTDQWDGLTLEQIREMEKANQTRLRDLISKGELSAEYDSGLV